MNVTGADWPSSVTSRDRGWCNTLRLRYNICSGSLRGQVRPRFLITSCVVDCGIVTGSLLCNRKKRSKSKYTTGVNTEDDATKLFPRTNHNFAHLTIYQVLSCHRDLTLHFDAWSCVTKKVDLHKTPDPRRRAFSLRKMDERFQHPFTCVVAGPTSCEKNEFVAKFIQHVKQTMTPAPQRIVWCYGEWQRRFDSVPNVKFIEGLPQRENFDGTQSTLLILDDLMKETNRRVTDLFTKGSHHRNLSVVYIVQNLFNNDDNLLTHSVLLRSIQPRTFSLF